MKKNKIIYLTLYFLVFLFSCEGKKQPKEINKLYFTNSNNGLFSVYATDSIFCWADSNEINFSLETFKFDAYYKIPFSEKSYDLLCDSILRCEPLNIKDRDIYACEMIYAKGRTYLIIQKNEKVDTFYFRTNEGDKINDFFYKIVAEKKGNAKKQNDSFGFEYVKEKFYGTYLKINQNLLEFYEKMRKEEEKNK